MQARPFCLACWPRIFVVVLSLIASPNSAHAQSENCVMDPPVKQVQGVAFYTDKNASVADPKLVAQDGAFLKPLQLFVNHLSAIVDNPNAAPADITCAQQMLDSWAQADALLQPPVNFEAMRERARFAIGFNIVALKLQASGHTVSAATLKWLHALSTMVANDFKTHSLKNNLYIWSGVDSATNALLSGDEDERNNATAVWKFGISQIQPDGSVATELDRKTRALLYHQYYLSGLLMLQSLRTQLGDLPTQQEEAKLKVLADLVSDSQCDPTKIGLLAGGTQQEIPPPYQYAVPAAFSQNILNQNWSKCAKLPAPLIDGAFGGDMSKAAQAIAANHVPANSGK
jgi:poly(beta-D-mannuronate) lyase